MVDAFKAIVVLVLIVIGFILYPALRQADSSDDLSSKWAESAIEMFVDSARGKGYVEVRDYEILLRQLESTGLLFDVQIEHYRKTLQPVYADPNNPATFQNRFTVEYVGYFNRDILDRLYPNVDLPADHEGRRYEMHVGDLFQVRVESQGKLLSNRLRSAMNRTGTDIPIVAANGGMVRSEAP